MKADVDWETFNTFNKRLYCLTFTYVLEPPDTTLQNLNRVVGFSVDITKYYSSPVTLLNELRCSFLVFEGHTASIPIHLYYPIIGVIVDISALTNIFKRLDFLKATTGGSGQILHTFWCTCINGHHPRVFLATLSNAWWHGSAKGTRWFTFFWLYSL